MGVLLLNGRVPLEWELPAIERGLAGLLERDMRQLAGLLEEHPRDPVPVPRPVTDVPLGLLP